MIVESLRFKYMGIPIYPMKEETEFKWIVNLLNNEDGSLSGSKGGTIKEFEKYAKAPFNSKEFRNWFNLLMKKSIISFFRYEDNPVGIPTKIYTFNAMKLIDYLNNFDLYKKAYKVALKDYFAIKRG